MGQVIIFVLCYLTLIFLCGDIWVLPKKERELICLVAAFIPLFILGAFRDFSIHNDTQAYIDHFKELSSSTPFWVIDTSQRFEVGYQLYEKFIHNCISSVPITLNIVSTAVILSATFIFFWKECSNIPLLLAIYFLSFQYLNQIGVLRQSLALVFFYMMYQSLKRHRFLLAAVLLIISALCHSSSVFNVLIFFCFILKPTKKNIKLILIGAFAVFFMYAYFLNYMQDFIYAVGGDDRYTETSADKGFFNMLGLFEFVNTLIATIIILRNRQRVPRSKADDPLLLITILYLVISLLSIRIWAFTRFGMYYLPLVYIYMCNLIGRRNKPFYHNALIVAYFLVYFFFLLSVRPEWYSIYPYHFTNLLAI